MTGTNKLTICYNEACRLLTLALNTHLLREPMQVVSIEPDEFSLAMTLGPLQVVEEPQYRNPTH